MSSVLIAEEISGLSSPTYNSGASNKKYVDNNTAPSGDISWAYFSGLSDVGVTSPVKGSGIKWNGSSWIVSSMGGSSVWNTRTGGIYYSDEVVLGPSGYDLGDYKLQVSGNTWLSGQTKFQGNMISGLTEPTYASGASNKKYVDDMVKASSPMTYSLSNIKISAQQNINMARFKCPTGKKAYVYQAYACNSGGTSTGELYVEMLAGGTTSLTGTDSVYKTSSNELQQGNSLGSSDDADYIEIRFMYSGSNASGYQFGTAMMQVGIY